MIKTWYRRTLHVLMIKVFRLTPITLKHSEATIVQHWQAYGYIAAAEIHIHIPPETMMGAPCPRSSNQDVVN